MGCVKLPPHAQVVLGLAPSPLPAVRAAGRVAQRAQPLRRGGGGIQAEGADDSDHCPSCLAYAHLAGVAKTEVAATALLAQLSFHFAPGLPGAGVAAEAASPRSRGPPTVRASRSRSDRPRDIARGRASSWSPGDCWRRPFARRPWPPPWRRLRAPRRVIPRRSRSPTPTRSHENDTAPRRSRRACCWPAARSGPTSRRPPPPDVGGYTAHPPRDHGRHARRRRRRGAALRQRRRHRRRLVDPVPLPAAQRPDRTGAGQQSTT